MRIKIRCNQVVGCWFLDRWAYVASIWMYIALLLEIKGISCEIITNFDSIINIYNAFLQCTF